MHELLVDGADELDRDYVEPIGEEVALAGLQVLARQESRHRVEMPRGGNRLRGREHVAVEGLSQPREQAPGGGGIAQRVRQVGVAAQRLQAPFGHDPPVDQVLREDAPPDERLGLAALEIGGDQCAFDVAQVAQQAAVDARLPADTGLPAPEPARFHREAAGERVEPRQFGVQQLEGFEPVRVRVVRSPGSAETVVEIDPFRRDDPQQRREPLVPDFPLPVGDRNVVGIVHVLEVHGEADAAAAPAVSVRAAPPPGVRFEQPQPDTGAGTGQRHARRSAFAVRQIACGFECAAQRSGDHPALPPRRNGTAQAPFAR